MAANGPRRGAAEPAVTPGELLIKFKPGTPRDERARLVAKQSGRIYATIPSLGIDAVEFRGLKRNGSLAKTRVEARNLKRDRRVVFAEPNFVYRASFTPNDLDLGRQWAWGRIEAYSAWEVMRGRRATTIAIVDTGVQRSHPDLDAKIVAGTDYVDGDSAPDDGNGHGTHVAGSAAAETNNATGVAGTCPNCGLMPVRVLDNGGSGSLLDVASGVRWAADHGARVINLSLTGPPSSTLEEAIDYAYRRKGAFVACAAGNNYGSGTAYPAGYANCFAVASTTSSDARSDFSNYGSWVEAAAPGSGIYSTWTGSRYSTMSGTSMATPHAAGLAGLLASKVRRAAGIRRRICATADRISGTGTLWTCGRVNANRAVRNLRKPPPPASETIANGGFENGTSPWTQTSSGGYQLIDPAQPHTGSYSARLGGYDNGIDTISQTVTVPASGTISYWWYMTTQERDPTPFDDFRVRLYDTSGALVATPRTFSNASGAEVWRQDSLSLVSYAGRTLRIEFSTTTDSSLPTTFFVDDVSLR